jgi:hypothetical protein
MKLGGPEGSRGQFLDLPKIWHGVGCGTSTRLGGMCKQSMVAYVAPIDAKPFKTYPKGRKCKCGTTLSIYNPQDKCAACQKYKLVW